MGDVTVTESTKLPLKLVALVVGAVASGVIWLQAVIFGLKSEIVDLKNEVRNMRERVDSSANDKWTATEMRLWTELLRSKNPAINVPDVSHQK